MMKLSIYSGVAILFVLFSLGCENEQETFPELNEKGLTREITELVPKVILDEMEELGMPIHGGAHPPFIEDTYLGSPFLLVSSNRPGDVIGHQFADYLVTFSGQNNDDLTIMVDYENGPESGSGLGSFIVGDGDKFTVFVEIDATYHGISSAKLTHVISGRLVEGGIEDLYFSNFMIDNYGNAQGVWIKNGEGRVAYDQDGFSERTNT